MGETKKAMVERLIRGTGIPASTVHSNMRKGLSAEEAVAKAKKRLERKEFLDNITWDGETGPVAYWSARLEVSPGAFIKRIDKHGVTAEAFISKEEAKELKNSTLTGAKGWDLGEMQPRRSVEELEDIGLWEKRQ